MQIPAGDAAIESRRQRKAGQAEAQEAAAAAEPEEGNGSMRRRKPPQKLDPTVQVSLWAGWRHVTGNLGGDLPIPVVTS